MIIYLETREVFLEHVRRNRIEEEVGERLKAIAGRRVSPAEVKAWRNSLQYVGQLLLAPQIPAALGVAIEYQIHNTARRIDLLLSGRSPDWGSPDFVDTDQGFTGVSVRAAMNACS